MSRIATLTLALCAGLVALPAGASGSRTQTMTFEAPVDLLDPASRAPALAEIASFGVTSLRVVLYWHDVAPQPDSRVKPRFDEADPAAYDWSRYDAIVDDVKARGWSVLLTVSGPVPRWATNGAKDTLTRPSPKEFRRFVEAAGRHYGTRVDRWSVWNEPNQPQFLLPQYSAVTHTPLSPRIYRKLLLAAQRGLGAAGLADVPLLMGETSPRGTGKVVAPLTFLRGVLCLDRRYRRTRRCDRVDVDGYAHHAYTTAQGPFFRPPQPNDVTIGVVSRLTAALDRAARAGAVARRLPIYLTEFGIQSFPDRIAGVRLLRQAEYRAIAERIAYENPRVVAFSQYLLRDDPPNPAASGAARYPGFESGLRTHGGRAKPALAGFRLPLAAERRGAVVSLWGLVRPATGPTRALVEHSRDGGWRPLATVATDARGYFRHTTAFRSGRRYRLAWTGPDARTYRGPPTRVYRR